MTSVASPPSGRIRLRLRRVCKWLIISVALIVAADPLFQFSRRQWRKHRYPPREKLVDIGGLRLHINCTGAGSPTVVMENGPNALVVWQLVQPEINKFTRVCSYDRAGFGWSDAPNEPRTSSNIADELDRLLTRAAIPGPYVLVGFEYGALNIRMFTSRHRKQVVGMVLVDPTHPDMYHRPPFNASTPRSTLSHRLLPRYALDRATGRAANAWLVSVHVSEPAEGMGPVRSRSNCSILSPGGPGAPSARKPQTRTAPCPVRLAPSAICHL